MESDNPPTHHMILKVTVLSCLPTLKRQLMSEKRKAVMQLCTQKINWLN